jgi:hypothetical protein
MSPPLGAPETTGVAMQVQRDGNGADKEPGHGVFLKSPHQVLGAGVGFVLVFAKSLREQHWAG